MPALDAALGELNARLKAGGHRCRVERRHTSLCLRATLPDRATPAVRRQQRIVMGLPATFASLPAAEQMALRLSHQLREATFDWLEWDRSFAPEGLTVERFWAAARTLYESKPRSPQAWPRTWRLALSRLPEAGPLTPHDLMLVLRRLPERSASRKVTGCIYGMVLDHLNIDSTAVRKTASGYSAKNVKRREIPSDAAIAELVSRLTKPHWHWTVGMIATFGLRPHEVLTCVLHKDNTCEIDDSTKTGTRIAWPCPSEWVELFDLHNIKKPTQDKYQLFKSCGRYLKYQQTPIRLYTLRHAYAIRLLLRGVPPEIGSRLMGHSLAVHTQIYQRWVRAQSLTSLRDRYDL